MHGSSFINERFRTFMLKRLKLQEANIMAADDSHTLEEIVESDNFMIKFESQFKRRINFKISSICHRWFYLAGLQPDAEGFFVRNKTAVGL
jgi:hypothetical protein